ncbi:hypothetical protein GL305_23685 [Nocardia seriolae]|nr:hypothetical protein [Nocardia seriolae]MTJ71197.1 hypothetical protein [Nocardia seriolae]MTJ88878.1 hypothetical protein [Nocardia seriolae]MTK32860.1 hypothetical protein [Nocardia seriolae]MTK41216.1 hypothetical protein [Nocardia seriolae]
MSVSPRRVARGSDFGGRPAIVELYVSYLRKKIDRERSRCGRPGDRGWRRRG